MAKRSGPDCLAPVIRCLLTLAFISAVVIVTSHSRAHAADFPCNSGDVACLKAAINAANLSPTLDTIILDGSTFTLTTVDNTTLGPSGLPSITSPIIIEGNGAIIERAATAAAHFRLFHIDTGGDLLLNRVTVRNGSLPPDQPAANQGGGILNVGVLFITNSTIADNRAGDDSTALDGFGGGGGGIANRAWARVRNSTVRNNRGGNSSGENADGGCGGGILSADVFIPPATFIQSYLEITDSTIASNRSGDGHLTEGRGGSGGGVCVEIGGNVDIVRSTINDNTAGKGFRGGDGGGLYVGSSVVANIANSTFFNNAAGGALGDGTFQGGFGGAIQVGTLAATVNITNSTMFLNSAGLIGLGLANGKGGAIAINPRLTEVNTVNVKNTIIAFNNLFTLFGEVYSDCFAAEVGGLRFIHDLGYNIDELTSCGFSTVTGSKPNTNPELVPGPPANNGGATATLAPCTGPGTPHSACAGMSPAIDVIPNGANGCGAPGDQDQRGLPRPKDGDGDGAAKCDIGAFEVQAPPAAVCGNGTLDPGEACDDGNTANGDCCSSTCQFELPATVCRAAADACDVAETCTGASAVCPADTFLASGTTCRPGADACDVAETCTGASAVCPADTFLASGTTCRPAAGACDVAETCTGASAACPANAFQPSGTACGDPAPTACTSPDSCNGLGSCQANHKPDGTVCTDGNACTTADTCKAGACKGTQVTCFGVNATICGDDGHNVILGTREPNVIHGLGGSDIIFGLGGNDLICGGDGNDILFGDSGNDQLDGGAGTDICIGGPGTDAFTRCEVRTQ